MKQCDNGHFYDEKRFESCPYCQECAGVGKTAAAGSVGKTVAAVPGAAALQADRGKTVGIIKKKIGIDPAVGFLICITGERIISLWVDETLSAGQQLWMWRWWMTILCPGRVMHWLHMMLSTTLFLFPRDRVGESPIATMNRWRWCVR